MQKILTTIVVILLLSIQSHAQQKEYFSEQEKIQQRRESDRQEEALRKDALKPNEKYSPTKVDTSTWGIDKNLQFEITNHLLGYSTIIEPDNTLQGVKITGIMNFAYYNSNEKDKTGRSKARYVFGLEFPITEINRRIEFWGGIGATLGDHTAMYLDAGLDYRIASWFKIQGGVNYNTARGLHPQISLGFVW